jgi:membrane protein YdbS with pleckstrin-like domain
VPQAQAAGQPSAAVPAQPVVLETFKPNPMGFWVDLFAALGTTAVILLMIFPILIIAIIPLALPIAFYVKKEFESIIYEMRQDGIWVKHGWISRSETMLFYRNIQDTSIEQGIFERLVGLQNLTVKSMSFQSAASAHFSYLTADDAKKMQELLKSQIENAASSSQSAPGAQQTVQAQALASQQKAIATAAAQFSSAPLVSPYKNDFIKGHLVGSVPFLAIGFVVGILLFVISGVFGQGWLAIFGFMIIGIGILVPIIDVAMAVIDASTYSYALTSAGLEIQLGLLSRFKKVIRYEKIQDIRMSCSFFESFAGMASMEIETGSRDIVSSKQGAMDAGVTQTERIPYLKLADARALRAKLLEISGIAYPGDQNILRQTHPLSPKKPLKKTVGFVGILSVQLFILGVLMGVLGGSFLSWIGWAIAAIFAVVMIVIAPIVYKYEQMYMQKYFYDENEDSLVIRKGVFGWSEIVVPFRNIQSIYVDQDWYDVYFDTWDVWITTVTATSGPMAHIDGTSREHAESLVRILVERVEKSRKRRV